MIFIQKKEHVIVFVSDPRSELNKVLREKKLLKKDGTPYKYVDIDMSCDFKEGHGYVRGIKVVSKSKEYHIIPSEYTFDFDGTPSDFIRIVNIFGVSYNVSFSRDKFGTKIEYSENNTLRSREGKKIAFGSFTNESEKKLISSFISSMSSNSGHMVSPLTNRFGKLVNKLDSHRSALLGYAHAPSYMKMVKGTIDPRMNNLITTVNSDIDFVLSLRTTSMKLKVNINSMTNGDMDLDITLTGGGVINRASASLGKREPYLLLSTYPIKIHGNTAPYFVKRVGKRPIFVTGLLFNRTDFLQNIKGGVNLLNMR